MRVGNSRLGCPFERVEVGDATLFNRIEKSKDIIIEAEKRGVKNLLEHYYHLLDAMKAADIPSLSISSSELQDAKDGIKKGRYVLKTVKLPFDLDSKEDTLRKAFLINLAKGLNGFGDVVNKHWENSFCPVCGSLPNIGVLGGDKEGGMSLCAAFARHNGISKGFHCPFCGNDNHEWLGYLVTESDEGYRINYCDKCKLYLKVVDMRKKAMVIHIQLRIFLPSPLTYLHRRRGIKG